MMYRSLFLSHGAPDLAISDEPANRFLRSLGRELPTPAAVVVMSGHWVADAAAVNTSAQFEAIYDFGGFDPALRQLTYSPTGDSGLVRDIVDRLAAGGVTAACTTDCGLDHGVWVPLLLMWPQADVAVVQVAQPARAQPAAVYRIGELLADLPDDVLLIGTGGAVHNLREVAWRGGETPTWASAFDHWLAATLASGNREALLHWQQCAPHARRAHPTPEHFMPLFFAAGAGGDASCLHRSFSRASLSMAAYGFSFA